MRETEGRQPDIDGLLEEFCFHHHSKSCKLMVLPVNWELSDPFSSSAMTVGSCRMFTGRSTVS